jgi:hypothetical protein
MCDVFDLHIQGAGFEQVQPPPAQHSLPGP